MHVAKAAKDRRPIVVWNLTRTCNLKCVHCYTASEAKKYEGELTTDQAKVVLDDLAAFKVPAVLFSGGEPLVRPDVFELAQYARTLGLRSGSRISNSRTSASASIRRSRRCTTNSAASRARSNAPWRAFATAKRWIRRSACG
jgi:uncharacterized radical SAM superfamily Fe-S cluster-containing enzyme